MHMSVCLCVPGHVGVDSEAAIVEDDDPQYGGGDEELGVDSQPGEIQTNLLPKVLPVEEGLMQSYYSHGHDKCCVLQSLLVQYLRKMFSHVSQVSTVYKKAHFTFYKAFLGRQQSICS